MAAVNNWDDATKVLWLKARLTGRAQVAIQRLSKETLGDLQALTRAMKERFEPNCQTEMYWRKFQTRLKRSDEAWHDFADDLSLVHNMTQEPAMRRDGCRRNRINFYSCDAMRRRSDKPTPDTGTLLKSDGRAQYRTFFHSSRRITGSCVIL